MIGEEANADTNAEANADMDADGGGQGTEVDGRGEARSGVGMDSLGDSLDVFQNKTMEERETMMLEQWAIEGEPVIIHCRLEDVGGS